MTEIELITKALKDAYKFVKEQEQTKETGELLINLFKAEILVKNCSIPAVVGRSEQLVCDCGNSDMTWYGNDDDKHWFCFNCKKEAN